MLTSDYIYLVVEVCSRVVMYLVLIVVFAACLIQRQFYENCEFILGKRKRRQRHGVGEYRQVFSLEEIEGYL